MCLIDLDIEDAYNLSKDNASYKGGYSDDNEEGGKLLKNRK